MIYVGIDVTKDKLDGFITNSDREVLFKSFSIFNNRDGFETLFLRIESVSKDLNAVELEQVIARVLAEEMNILIETTAEEILYGLEEFDINETAQVCYDASIPELLKTWRF